MNKIDDEFKLYGMAPKEFMLAPLNVWAPLKLNAGYSIVSLFYPGLNEYQESILHFNKIEVGAIEKETALGEQFKLLVFKIGPDNNHFMSTLPLDPTGQLYKSFATTWANYRILSIAHVDLRKGKDGQEEPFYKHIKVKAIPSDLHEYLSWYFIHAIERGERWSMKYFDWFMEVTDQYEQEGLDALWRDAKKLGAI